MQSNEGNRSSLPALGFADFATLCLGFGCFFAVCPFSALGTAAMLRDAMGWQEILAARTTFLVFSAVFFAARSNKGPGWCLPGFLRSRLSAPMGEALFGALSAAVGFVLLAFGNPLLSGGALAALSGCLLGFAMATLGGGWFGAFFAVRRKRGRTACVVAFACSFLATVLLTWAANLLCVDHNASLAVVLALLAASWGLYGLATHRGRLVPEPASTRALEFVPSTYARTLLLGFGASWACAYNTTIELGYGTGPDQFARWALTLVLCGALLVLAVAFVRKVDIGEVRFGLMLRWVVTAIGCLWAFMPALVAQAPILAGALFIMVFWVQLTVFFVFAMEVCLESDLPFHQVLARYFGIFVAATCAGSLVFWLIKVGVPQEGLAYSLLGGFGAACSLLVIPFLPSRGSSANVFTMAHLPEDEGSRERNERARRNVAEECGFTTRETQVFELLMRGMTRDEVAAELQISPWTVRTTSARCSPRRAPTRPRSSWRWCMGARGRGRRASDVPGRRASHTEKAL